MHDILIAVLVTTTLVNQCFGVGCSSDPPPCEHKCTDTIDSYYCTCWPNYLLQPDGHTCKSATEPALSALYQGCYEDNSQSRDMDNLVWDRDDASVLSCLHSCSSRGFIYAGLATGRQCWCDSSYQRLYNTTDTCTTPCTGSQGEICGGSLALSVYSVPIDERYMGCFYEDELQPDLPVKLWDASSGNPPYMCVDECSRSGYSYAGVFNGGTCRCGNSYGSKGMADPDACNVGCYSGYSAANCGGNVTNAIYRVVRAQNFAPTSFGPEQFATISMNELYKYPNYNGILSNSFIIYASDSVIIPDKDKDCFNTNCYGDDICGSITTPPGYDQYVNDVVIRDFHVKISAINSYLTGSNPVKRVYVYAQTLVIDQSVTFSYSVYIRARQIIVDYSKNPTVTFDHNSPDVFDIDLKEAEVTGPPSDLTFQKLSMMCARMLLGTSNSANNQIAFDIIHDVVRDRVYSLEQQYYMDYVRAARSNFTSIGAYGLHWAPFYSKSYYSLKLTDYSVLLEEYATTYAALIDSATDCSTFKSLTNELRNIFFTTSMELARAQAEYAKDSISIATVTYLQVYTEFNESRVELEAAAEVFKEGIKSEIKQILITAAVHLTTSVLSLGRGSKPCESDGLKDEIELVTGIMDILKTLEVIMEELTDLIKDIEEFLAIVQDTITSDDFERYSDNVEAVAALYVMIVEWDNFASQMKAVFDDPSFSSIGGALTFRVALIDFCQWGKTLTKATTEYANSVRDYVTANSMYQSYQEMQIRFNQIYNNIGAECQNRYAMAYAFYEQNYDMMLTTNDLLIQFCEALYYEQLAYCPASSQPSFNADLNELKSHVDQAVLIADNYFRRSSATIPLLIMDPDGTAPDCVDPTLCPVNVFRNTRTFYYEIPLTERQLSGVDIFLINELFVQFPGSTSTNPSYQDFQMLITRTGPFMDRSNGAVSTFYSRPMTAMKYRYNIATNVTLLSCNLYGEGSSMIQHAAPFATWWVQIDDTYSGYIDVSNVQAVNMTLKGSFLNQNILN